MYYIHIYKNGKTNTQTRKTQKGAAALLKQSKGRDGVTRVTVEIETENVRGVLVDWKL